TLALLHLIARRRSLLAWSGASVPAIETSARSRLAVLGIPLALGLAGALSGIAQIRAPSTYILLSLIVHALFRAVLLASIGLVLGCALGRRWLREAGTGALPAA